MPTRVYLDIDIGGHRAAHALARAFVEATSLRFGLSSPRLEELGGSERARLPELFESAFEWASRGRIELSPAPHERVVIELFEADAPNCCANFVALCTGAKGKAKGSGLREWPRWPLVLPAGSDIPPAVSAALPATVCLLRGGGCGAAVPRCCGIFASAAGCHRR